jgi:hypothetical protein
MLQYYIMNYLLILCLLMFLIYLLYFAMFCIDLHSRKRKQKKIKTN